MVFPFSSVIVISASGRGDRYYGIGWCADAESREYYRCQDRVNEAFYENSDGK